MRYLLGFAMLLAGCDTGPTPQEARIESAKQEVAALLRDPAGAQFRNVRLHATVPNDNPDMAFVCGEVNGTNAFGGRTGFKRFIGMPKIAGPDGAPMQPILEETSPSPQAFASEWRTAC